VVAEDPVVTVDVVATADAAEAATEEAEADEVAEKEANLVRVIGPAPAAETTTSPGEQRAIVAKFPDQMAPEVKPLDAVVDVGLPVASAVAEAETVVADSEVVAVATVEVVAAARCVAPHAVAVEDPHLTECRHSKKALLPFKFSFSPVPFKIITHHPPIFTTIIEEKKKSNALLIT